MLGTVEAPDGRQITVADVPGLIEGASEGVGLGHEFLAHLERARLLVHVIDVSGDAEQAFRTINRELEQYGAGLDERPQAVVLNKIDLLPEPAGVRGRGRARPRVFHVSCATGAGIDELRRGSSSSARRAAALAVEEGAEGLAEFLVYRPQSSGARVPDPPHRPRLPRHGHAARGRRARGALRDAGARKGAEVEVGDETLVLE